MVLWPLRNDRPAIEIHLVSPGGSEVTRWLVADTGAGSRRDVFQLILDEDDCLQCGGIPVHQVTFRGSYAGRYPVYLVDVRIPALNLDDSFTAAGVPQPPRGFDGIACFQFLRRFHYGNFANPDQFGLAQLGP